MPPNVCSGSVLAFAFYSLLCVLSSFAIILTRKGELVALLLLSFGCRVTVNVLYLFLKVPWVGLQFLIVVFPDHTHFKVNLCIYAYVQTRQSLRCSHTLAK